MTVLKHESQPTRLTTLRRAPLRHRRSRLRRTAARAGRHRTTRRRRRRPHPVAGEETFPCRHRRAGQSDARRHPVLRPALHPQRSSRARPEIGADGIHVGQDDLSVAEARARAGAGVIVGKSTHSLEQAVAAEKEGADYIGVGPIYATPTKPDYVPVGPALIGQVRAAVRVPQFCIGGINEATLPEVLAAGARASSSRPWLQSRRSFPLMAGG
jgi:hypothetical protein